MPPIVVSRVASHQSPSIIEGSSVNLWCEAISGDLPIAYSWTDPNGQALSPADTDGIVSFTLSIYGNYTCSGSNLFGVDGSTVEILEPGTARPITLGSCLPIYKQKQKSP